MSTARTPGPRDTATEPPRPAPPKPSPPKPGPPRPPLVFDDPLDRQSSDDTDAGWGERQTTSGDSAADLARFLDEKPPHHI
ncbi:hypothetical protein [Streptomyces niveus]|uniref:Uncharacterized protein n=1 Tax=Streptomyces niveus TaxID=193462 RepID=A0A1U9QWK9_STRNV|nr:hypothetical protein [Streptomyces niveus]AQU68201.1 hypothetical protein BBN63_20265 [Streptomyces niveus]